jgi:uncharacterized membrane protein
MPFCSNCGAAVEGRFCAKCGTEVGGAAPPPPGPSGSASLLPPAAAGLSDNVVGALCYVGLIITGILFLLLEPYSKKPAIRFHAFQAIFLNAAWIVLSLVLGIIRFGFFLSPLISVVAISLWVYMIVTTYQGKKVVLPLVGSLAQQQA